MALGFTLFGCSGRYEGPESDHFNGKIFFDPQGFQLKTFGQFLKWQLGESKTPWPVWVENKTRPEILKDIDRGRANVVFVNHATVLIQLPGINILTDPVWSDRVSPVSWAGPKRVRSPGLLFENLPKIDIVMISHNHYDHLDLPTLVRLKESHDPRFFVPLGDDAILKSVGISKVTSMDWWQEVDLGPSLKLNFTPAKHWSGRGFYDRNASLWGAYLIRNSGHNIYFAGDTGMGSHFAAVQKQFGDIDVAFLPIGAYEPRWFMRDSHMNPEDAVLAHQALKAKLSVAIHFGTWQLTNEGMDAPRLGLDVALLSAGISKDQFVALETGQSMGVTFR